MRYSLRNQNKIKEKLGVDFHRWLIDSIDEYFSKNESIEEYEYVGERFKVVHINNVQPKTDSLFELYVIKKTFDVYLLAYKSCMS